LEVRTIQKWFLIGIGEVILCLILLAIAPIFLNSNLPIVGFLIWLTIPLILGGSITYVLLRIVDALKATNMFVARFPEYSYLKTVDFIGISSEEMRQRLEAFAAIQDDPDCDILNIAPLDLLHKTKRK
jgi:hypothetical protein